MDDAERERMAMLDEDWSSAVAIQPPDPDAHVSRILDVAGLHLCPENADPARVIWCGCRPGHCDLRAPGEGRKDDEAMRACPVFKSITGGK